MSVSRTLLSQVSNGVLFFLCSPVSSSQLANKEHAKSKGESFSIWIRIWIKNWNCVNTACIVNRGYSGIVFTLAIL